MSEVGHNKGPSMAPGGGFRTLAWSKARKTLLPTLPLEIVRIRVARAKRLGLDYKTYATIRATTGRDIVAFLFSGNALELTPRRVELPNLVAMRLTETQDCARMAAVYLPLIGEAVDRANPEMFHQITEAPAFTLNWPQMRDQIVGAIRAQKLPADSVVLVAATSAERDWCAAAKLAGVLSADDFFRRSHV
ncbi:MAG: hypothetical protein ACJAXT_000280 [Paracoccaceae bacterium]|jgi:hypothetical protein